MPSSSKKAAILTTPVQPPGAHISIGVEDNTNHQRSVVGHLRKKRLAYTGAARNIGHVDLIREMQPVLSARRRPARASH